MRKAFVFSPGSAGLSMIQTFGIREIPCVAMDCARLPGTRRIGTYSKYASFQKCPDPLEGEERWIEFLYEVCRREEEKPVLFPTADHWTAVLARHRDVLDEVALPCVGRIDPVGLFLDKPRFYEAGSERGWMTPALRSADEIEAGVDVRYPIAAKPISKLAFSSQDGRRAFRNVSVTDEQLRLTVIRNKREWERFALEYSRYFDRLLFQDYIEGFTDQMYCVGLYADRDSNIRGTFTGRKLRGYPALYGDCTAGTCHAVPDAVMENTARIVEETGFSGIGEFEYKQDPATGTFHLIEVNPRPWSWIGITEACPDNIPLTAFLDLAGECPKEGRATQPEKGPAPSGSVVYVKTLQDLANCLVLYKKDHLPWVKTLREWKSSFRGSRVIYAEWNAADWKASVAWLVKDLLLVPVKHAAKRWMWRREKRRNGG